MRRKASLSRISRLTFRFFWLCFDIQFSNLPLFLFITTVDFFSKFLIDIIISLLFGEFLIVLICFHKLLVWKLKCTTVFLFWKGNLFYLHYSQSNTLFFHSTQLLRKTKLWKWHTHLLQNNCVHWGYKRSNRWFFDNVVSLRLKIGQKRALWSLPTLGKFVAP